MQGWYLPFRRKVSLCPFVMCIGETPSNGVFMKRSEIENKRRIGNSSSRLSPSLSAITSPMRTLIGLGCLLGGVVCSGVELAQIKQPAPEILPDGALLIQSQRASHLEPQREPRGASLGGHQGETPVTKSKPAPRKVQLKEAKDLQEFLLQSKVILLWLENPKDQWAQKAGLFADLEAKGMNSFSLEQCLTNIKSRLRERQNTIPLVVVEAFCKTQILQRRYPQWE